MDEFELYAALWRRAERNGTDVRYEDDRNDTGTGRSNNPSRPSHALDRTGRSDHVTYRNRRRKLELPDFSSRSITSTAIVLPFLRPMRSAKS